jgi:hypothetical protein
MNLHNCRSIRVPGNIIAVITIAVVAVLAVGCTVSPASRESYHEVYMQRCQGSFGGERPYYCDR